MSGNRSVSAVHRAIHTLEGAGFAVRRPFPNRGLMEFDPFLLLDEMGPADLKPGEAKGAPDHPHRGFETVTYMLEGGMVHKDSAGNRGQIGPGDVQWMTAGSGVVHSEMPALHVLENGGRMHGFQLWVNLPARDKMVPPRYQDTPSAKIPVARSADGGVFAKVVAGEALGARAVIETRTPILYVHYTLQPGARAIQHVPTEYSAFAYVFGGQGLFGREERPAADGQMVVFSSDGDEASLAAPAGSTEPLNALFVAGVPLKEPVARYGPFVMNTERQITEAFEDYRSGRMGKIKA